MAWHADRFRRRHEPWPLGDVGDVKLALRQMRRSRSYFAVAVLTLGIGIGATTAIFSVVNGVLLRPLPYRDPAELVLLTEEAPRFGRICRGWSRCATAS